MIAPADMAHCREAIRHGSLSFHAASRLLPRYIRDPALALYAFCRLADDEVDLKGDEVGAVLHLRERLELVYSGIPRNAPADRAFAAIVDDFEMPRALPEALLEGLAWDALGYRYATLSDLRAYSARVAAAVGAMMCVLMRVRDARALARACDLGVAMQLTNIARDVGEDARNGRLYLPEDWVAEAGLDPARLVADPQADMALRGLVARLLRAADDLYRRAETGIALLPRRARPGIFAARHAYAGIGGAVRRNGYDSVTVRGRTTRAEKAGWLALSTMRAGLTAVMPRAAMIYAPPLPETAFLVDSAARVPRTDGAWGEGRAGSLIGIFAELERHDRARA